MASKNVNIKKRNWAFVAYPDSLPVDWVDQLRLAGVQAAISPLHDRDLDPDGQPKKPHYHVILVYGNPTTYGNVRQLTNGRLGQTVPQPLEQVRGYYRYLTHQDNPDKAQYDPAQIQLIGGFDLRDFCEMTKSEVDRIKREIMTLIRDNGITEYADLIDVLLDGGQAMQDWFSVASSNTLFFRSYLISAHARASGGRKDG